MISFGKKEKSARIVAEINLASPELMPEALDEKPFRLVKSFSLIAIVLIFATVLTLAAVVSRQAEEIITTRVEDDTIKLMENLNHQMYIGFLVEAYRQFGVIRLREPAQQELLRRVIANTIYGFDIRRVLLYDLEGRVVFATDQTVPTSLAEDMGSYLEAIRRYSLPEPSYEPGPAADDLWRQENEAPLSNSSASSPLKSPEDLVSGSDAPLGSGERYTSGTDINSLYLPEAQRQYRWPNPYLFVTPPSQEEQQASPREVPLTEHEAFSTWFWQNILQDYSQNTGSFQPPLPPDAPLAPAWAGVGEEMEYVEKLRQLTVHRYEGGSYLLANFFPRGEVTLKTYRAMENYGNRGLSGVLELSRDLTPEYRLIANLQYFAVGMAALLAVLLTVLLRLVVSRGEAIITKRNLERQELREKLDQAERLAGLGSMVATVAHEIRNPLGIIHSTADVLGRLAADPAQAKLSHAIVEEADRLSDVVTEFLDFAKPPTPKLAPMVVEEVLEEILAFLEVSLTRAGVEVRTVFRSEPAPIMGDVSMLHRAFLNLLLNAAQAMDDGGLITVSTALVGRAGSEAVRVSIIDTGPGLSPEATKKLFSPFYTTKAKGTGLGLVIVHNIIEKHHGDIKMVNGPPLPKGEEGGPGLQVIIHLPVSPPPV